MKRGTSDIYEINQSTLSQIRKQLNELSSSVASGSYVSTIQREELLLFIRELDDTKRATEKILSLECNQLMNVFPEEIWKKIFSEAKVFPGTLLTLEGLLRKIACVSKLWSKLIDELVPELNLFPTQFSPWVLMKYRNRNLQKLSLSSFQLPSQRICDDLLVQFTSLTSLNLSRNKEITANSLEKLTNLTKLDLIGNSRILPNSLEKLSKLKNLDLFLNKKISAHSLLKLPHLESLSFCSSSLVLEQLDVLVQLTNLKTLQLDLSFASDQTSNIESALPHFVNLHTFRLNGCRSFNCRVLSKLSNLKSLYLSSINSNSIKEDFKLLTNLTSISINYMENFDDEVIKLLTNLVSLSTDSPITENAFKDLYHLTHLAISDSIEITRDGFRNLTNLVSLDIGQMESPKRKEVYEQLAQFLPNLK